MQMKTKKRKEERIFLLPKPVTIYKDTSIEPAARPKAEIEDVRANESRGCSVGPAGPIELRLIVAVTYSYLLPVFGYRPASPSPTPP